jgi:hypothetical protein
VNSNRHARSANMVMRLKRKSFSGGRVDFRQLFLPPGCAPAQVQCT